MSNIETKLNESRTLALKLSGDLNALHIEANGLKHLLEVTNREALAEIAELKAERDQLKAEANQFHFSVISQDEIGRILTLVAEDDPKGTDGVDGWICRAIAERNKLRRFYIEIVRFLGHDLVIKEITELRANPASRQDDAWKLRDLLRDRVFYAAPGAYARTGYTLDTSYETAHRDIDYRDCPLYATPDEAINAAMQDVALPAPTAPASEEANPAA